MQERQFKKKDVVFDVDFDVDWINSECNGSNGYGVVDGCKIRCKFWFIALCQLTTWAMQRLATEHEYGGL